MGKVAKAIKDAKISFILPNAGKMIYSKISDTDKALCYVIDRGYVEAESFNICYSFSEFLDKTLEDKFTKVGKIDKVRLSSGKYVYRQRVYFTSISLLFPILSHFDIDMIIPSSFKIGISQMCNCSDSVKTLENYMKSKRRSNYTIDDWLTDCCLVQLYIFSLIEGVDIKLHKPLKSILKPGLLDRAPYICGSFDKKNNKSSVIIPPEKYLILDNVDILTDSLEEQHEKLSDDYHVQWKGLSIPIYGFTMKNLTQDKYVRERDCKSGR